MRYDAIVVGAGLSGLVAALALRRAGLRVLLVERRSAAGGLCGTHTLDGFEFAIGCAEFGSGLMRMLRDFGVRLAFEPARIRFVCERESLELPPGWRELLSAVPHLPDLVRLGRAVQRAQAGYLSPVIRRHVRSSRLIARLETIAHALALTPDQVRIEALREEINGPFHYGYHRPVVPVGGPAALTAALVRTYCEAGGDLQLGNACRTIHRDGLDHAVSCDHGTFFSRAVLSSEGRWEEYSSRLKPGLAAGFLHLAVQKPLAFPAGVQTLVDYPVGSGEALARLDAGELAIGDAPVVVSRRGVPAGSDHYTLSATVLMPRGQEAPTPEETRALETQVIERAERLLPGLERALLYRGFVGPKAFQDLHGLSSRPTPYVRTPGFRKPDVCDPDRDLYFIGNSVGPPGDHAGAAMLSARWAAQRVTAAIRAS